MDRPSPVGVVRGPTSVDKPPTHDPADTVSVHYVGKLEDGKIFDSSDR